ncbi:MAG: hypothetical protein JWN67_1816 [Actinomycetia bacterium]|nr:hypothetical protein [Actinomycetes bacterium]
MSDSPPVEPSLEQRLGLVLRGVQRMADGLGSIESKLPDLASNERLKALSDRVDEYRVRSRAEVAQVGEVVTALANAVDVVMREQQALSEAVRTAPPGEGLDGGAVERLTEAVRALRDDLAESHRLLREETKAAVERVAGEQAERAVRLHEAVGEAGVRTVSAIVGAIAPGDDVAELAADLRQLRTTLDGRQVVLTESITSIRTELNAALDEVRAAIAATPEPVVAEPHDDTFVRAALAELRADLRRLQGDLAAAAGQVRADAGAEQARLREEAVAAIAARVAELPPPDAPELDAVLELLSGLETRLPQPTSIEPVLARLDALEAKLAEPPPAADAVLARLVALETRLTERLVPTDLSGLDARLAAIESRLADAQQPAPTGDLGGVYDRLGGIEWKLGERLDPLGTRLEALEQQIESLRHVPAPSAVDPRLAERLASLEAGLEQVAQREDVRRGVDRVLGAVSSAEQAVAGEVRAVDARVGAIAEEVRIVRVLRDGLDALADGIDGVRQLASRTATSQQMTEVTRELGAVLAEIETARTQVLRVEQSTSPVAAEVVAVGSEVDDLGRRIDQLAEVIEDRMAPSTASAEVAQRLRQMSVTARQLGNGVLEDLRSRRKR